MPRAHLPPRQEQGPRLLLKHDSLGVLGDSLLRYGLRCHRGAFVLLCPSMVIPHLGVLTVPLSRFANRGVQSSCMERLSSRKHCKDPSLMHPQLVVVPVTCSQARWCHCGPLCSFCPPNTRKQHLAINRGKEGAEVLVVVGYAHFRTSRRGLSVCQSGQSHGPGTSVSKPELNCRMSQLDDMARRLNQ